MRILLSSLALVFAAPLSGAAQSPAPDKPRPIPIRDSVFIEDLTWMEVRDLIADGKTTAIVASGGVEQNGPLPGDRGSTMSCSGASPRRLPATSATRWVAPILKLVPEGDFDPPTGHMRYPGTVGLSEETFRAVVRDVCRSPPRPAAFEKHRPDRRQRRQPGRHEGGRRRTRRRLDGRARGALHPRVLTTTAASRTGSRTGAWSRLRKGSHDDYAITSMMAAVDPNSIRASERRQAGALLHQRGGGGPSRRDEVVGVARLFRHRAEVTVKAIRAAIAALRHELREPGGPPRSGVDRSGPTFQFDRGGLRRAPRNRSAAASSPGGGSWRGAPGTLPRTRNPGTSRDSPVGGRRRGRRTRP